ncbi:hypothetical protein [Thomasclavelia spiroformis]|uniref:hypothetical protein n=1 Tax=Thomasclavelia spiroformis TaxID=29348 RepID=UPI0029439B1F|nr:hypothetical protein [Thomasclavelia spiroformis]
MDINEISHYQEHVDFCNYKLNDAKQTLAIIKSELLNKSGSLNNETIASAISLVIDSINNINSELHDTFRG